MLSLSLFQLTSRASFRLVTTAFLDGVVIDYAKLKNKKLLQLGDGPNIFKGVSSHDVTHLEKFGSGVASQDAQYWRQKSSPLNGRYGALLKCAGIDASHAVLDRTHFDVVLPKPSTVRRTVAVPLDEAVIADIALHTMLKVAPVCITPGIRMIFAIALNELHRSPRPWNSPHDGRDVRPLPRGVDSGCCIVSKIHVIFSDGLWSILHCLLLYSSADGMS